MEWPTWSTKESEMQYLVNKRVWNTVLGCNLKNSRMISVRFWGKLCNPSLCPNQYCWRSWSWMVLSRPTRPFRTNTQKRCPFHYRGLECKSRKSRNTITGKFDLGVCNEAGERLIEFCQENALVIANTLFQQHEMTLHMEITTWLMQKSDWLYSLQPEVEKLYTVSKNKTRS